MAFEDQTRFRFPCQAGRQSKTMVRLSVVGAHPYYYMS